MYACYQKVVQVFHGCHIWHRWMLVCSCLWLFDVMTRGCKPSDIAKLTFSRQIGIEKQPYPAWSTQFRHYQQLSAVLVPLIASWSGYKIDLQGCDKYPIHTGDQALITIPLMAPERTPSLITASSLYDPLCKLEYGWKVRGESLGMSQPRVWFSVLCRVLFIFLLSKSYNFNFHGDRVLEIEAIDYLNVTGMWLSPVTHYPRGAAQYIDTCTDRGSVRFLRQ